MAIFFIISMAFFVSEYHKLTYRGEYSEVVDTRNYVDPGLGVESSGYIFSPEFSYNIDGVKYSTEYKAGFFPANSLQVSAEDINSFRSNNSYYFSGVKFEEDTNKVFRMSGVVFGGNIVYSIENLVDKNSLLTHDISLRESEENNTIEILYRPSPIRYVISVSVIMFFLGFIALGVRSKYVEWRKKVKGGAEDS